MCKKLAYYTADEKVNIIRKHLLEKVPISDVCEQHKTPNWCSLHCTVKLIT